MFLLVNFGTGYTGLDTVGYAVYYSDGSEYIAHTTIYDSATGNTGELGTGSGQYGADITIGSGFTGYITWDTGGSSPVYVSAAVNGFPITTSTLAGELSLYCTYTDIDNEIDDLLDHVPQSKKTTTDDAVAWVNSRIIACGYEIDGRLGMTYGTPFDPVPSIITTIALYLSCSRILSTGYVGEIPADSRYVDTYYKRADDLLKRIESGDIVIPQAEKMSDSAGVLSNTSDIGMVFTQTTYDSDGDVLTTGSMDTW